MTKISKLEVNDFRGFEGSRIFEFEDADIVIFLGMNGFGKTSVFDAVEWCLTGHLARYDGYLESGRKQDFAKEKEVLRNKYASNPNTLVKLELSDGKKFGRRITVGPNEPDYGTGSIIDGYNYGLKSISNQEIDPEYAHHYFSATHILSQETIHHFITSKRPEDRYKALSINFGTSLYEPFEDNALRLVTELKREEDAISTALSSERRRLEDFKNRQEVQEDQIKAEIAEANSLIKNLGDFSDEYNIALYSFENDKIKGLAKDELQKLTSIVTEQKDKLEKKKDILVSLTSDHRNWQEKNKELKILDQKVIKNKQQIARIKDYKANLDIALASEKSHKDELEKETHDFNIASEIEKKISLFIDNRKKIDLVFEEIDKHQTASKGLEAYLVKSTEEELRLQKQLKSANDLIAEAAILKEDLSKEISKNSALNLRSSVNQKIASAEKSLASLLERREAVRAIENFLQNEFLVIEGHDFIKYTEDFPNHSISQIDSLINAKLFVTECSKKIERLQSEKIELEKSYKKQTEDLTRSKVLLANALDVIDGYSDHCPCPVCETEFLTASLLLTIKSKLDDASSRPLLIIKDDILRNTNELEIISSKEKAAIENLKHIRDDLVGKFHEELKNLNDEIEKENLERAKLQAQRKYIEEEESKLKYRLSILLEKDIQDIAVASSELEAKYDALIKSKEFIQKDLTKAEETKLGFKKQIDLYLTESELKQEKLKSLQSEEFSLIQKFLIQRNLPIKDSVEAQLNNYINKKSSLIKEIQEKLNHTKGSIVQINKNISEAIKDSTELELETINIDLSAKITEINRFLFDYKQRCTKVALDLDASKKDIEKLSNFTSTALLEKRNIIDLLSSLIEKARTFSLFSSEDIVRKEISKIETKVNSMQTRTHNVRRARSVIDELKKNFPDVLQKYINQNLDEKLFNKIYQGLNPHRRFQSIKLDVKVSHNKVGIHFDAKQSKISGRPEFLFSSAQLNTFGVSMFLSMALRQNWLKLDTVLLDDPIQNLDDINILSLIDLMRGLLDFKAGKQIILSTHDERFYNLVKHKFVDYKLKAYRYESYGRVTPDVI